VSLAQYGFQKLVLLYCAGYSRAELPLDDSVSIIAPNNTGKTSLINALQFLLIIDRRLMDFGAHTVDSSRKFYFPDNSAYILLEVLLPTGMAVIGCVGKGLSHDYEYFAYQGGLEVEDYRLDDGKLVTQPKLIDQLLERGKLAKVYQSGDLRALLYGNRQKQRTDDPDLTVFPLEFTSQAATYQRILTRTLRLDSLDSRQVKEYLLEIYKNELHDRSVNFKDEWDKSFADVNYDKSQYDAVFRNHARIISMEQQQQNRKTLRGKIILWRPSMEKGLTEWEAYFNGQSHTFQGKANQLSAAFHKVEERQKSIYEERANTKVQLKQQEELETQYQELTLQFEFVRDLAQLTNQLRVTQDQRDELVSRLKNAENQQNPNTIRRNINKCHQEIGQLHQQLASLDNNLYLQLQQLMPIDSFDALTRLLAGPVLSLSVAAGDKVQLLDENRLCDFGQEVANRLNGSRLEATGLSIDLSTLEPNLQIRTAGELQTDIEELQRQQAYWEGLLVTVEQFAQEKAKADDFDRKLDQLRDDIKQFEELLTLRSAAAERQQSITALKNKLLAIKDEEATLVANKSKIAAEQQRLQDQSEGLNNRHKRIHIARQQRKDHEPPFNFLEQLPHLPCIESAHFEIDQLADQIETYNRDCQELRELDKSLAESLIHLHHEGINKFQVQDDQEQELQALFNYTAQLNQEQAAIERKARSAVVQVAAILRDLRDSLETLKRRMSDFNNKINRRQLSDLKVFKIEPREEEIIVNAIRTLISTSEQVESGNSFDLFDHNAVLDDKELNKAKDLLIKQGEKLGSLKVEHLFRLVFVIGKQNQNPAEFEDLDSAASNGTVLMAKLITGLAMLNQMQDPRKSIKTACYLDEAASLDQRNQRNLIETAAEFGFSLIFASPEPQITARYCVPIGILNGKNHISRLNWQILKPLEEVLP
jgi:DNA repair exonuclease SbcCD ATPase subunit